MRVELVNPFIAAAQAADSSVLEAALRIAFGTDRKLVEVRQRSVLERGVGVDMPPRTQNTERRPSVAPCFDSQLRLVNRDRCRNHVGTGAFSIRQCFEITERLTQHFAGKIIPIDLHIGAINVDSLG